MTKNELIQLLNSPADLILIQHENMKDVAFWPLSVDSDKDFYKIAGIWYNMVIKQLIGNGKGDAARETINIKKEDLEKWKTMKI